MNRAIRYGGKSVVTIARIVDKFKQEITNPIAPVPELIILWNDFSTQPDNQSIVSLPSYIEENSDRLRSKFVECIDSLADVVPSKSAQSIAQLLSLDDEFSLWWMNILSEKCNFSKSPWMTDAIKCIALLEIISLDTYEINTLNLCIENIDLVLILKSLASFNNIRCVTVQSSINLSLHRLKGAIGAAVAPLRLMLRASVWFIIYFLQSRYISANKSTLPVSRKPSVTIFSYLSRRQDFVSSSWPTDPYWHSLPEIIYSRNYSINWIYIYAPDKTLPSLQSASDCISFLNSQRRGFDRHLLLESFATYHIFFRAFKSWLHLCWRVGRVLSVWAPKSYSLGFDVSLFTTSDWQTSIFGSTGLKNILYIYLFESYFSSLPKQHYSLFLQENMNWEYAFIRAAKLHESGCIIGFPHTIIRYWDLRYFYANQQFIGPNNLTSIRNRPQPDIIAVCSEVSLNLLMAGDCYSSQLACVEALRYQHLNLIGQSHPSSTNRDRINMLMVGQYDLATTNRALRILDECLQLPTLGDLTFNILFKAHPSSPVDLSEYAFPSISLWTGSLEAAAQVSRLAISPLQTAASLDLYLMGLPTVVIDDATCLNLCPLREFSSYRKAAIPVELADQILQIINSTATDTSFTREEPYLFGSDLARWQRLFDQ